MALVVYMCVHNRAVEDLHFILEKQLLKERLTEKGIYSFLQITKQKNAKTLKFKTWYAAKSKWSFIFKIGEYLLSSEIFLKNSSVQYGLGVYREFCVWCARSAGLYSLLEWGGMLVVADICLQAQGVLFPKCAIRLCLSWALRHRSALLPVYSQQWLLLSRIHCLSPRMIWHKWMPVVTKSCTIFLLVVGWLFSHYFQLPSLGLALY